MPGTALENFTDFVKFTHSAVFSGVDDFLNEATLNTYTMPRLLKGKGMDKVVQGGENIKDWVMFDESNTFQNYKPNAQFTWTQPQVATEKTINWRFSMDHMSWTDHEIELNMPQGMTRSHQNVQYKRLMKKIEQRMWTSVVNGLETKLWADPNSQQAEMEDSTGGEQYSILSFITEDTTSYHSTGWTNIAGIDPANESGWRNQVETYDYDDPDDSDGDSDGLIDAFDNMTTDVEFIPPDFHKEHFEGANMEAYRQAIFCSKGGLNQYKRLLRAANDTLVRKQDASYNRPQWDGVDLVRAAKLDTLSMIWNNTTAGTAGTETGYTTDGYRYFFVNGNYLTPIFHVSRYFFKKAPFNLGAAGQPWTNVCPVDVWWNLFPHSRRRQGIVAPQ